MTCRERTHWSVSCIGAVLAATLLTAPLHANSPSSYVVTNWQTEQGLPQNSVYDIVQDRKGYLWLATAGGIVRFDGVHCKVFGAANIPTLRTNRISCLHESRSGDLWVGTFNSGLIRLQDGVPTTYTDREGLPGNLVNSIREDAAGTLWVNTSRGISRFDGRKFERYSTHHGKAVGEFLLQARDGSMWFRSGMDVVRLGSDGSEATPTGGFMAHETPDGSVWIAFHDQYRLVRYYRGVFSEVPLPGASARQWQGMYPKQGALRMATDTDGALLLLTPAGFVRAVDGKLSAPEALRLPVDTPELPKVFSMLVDREGNRWVGTLSTGLFRCRRAAVMSYTRSEGLTDSPVNAVFQDREGRIWLGGDELHWFDGHEFHRFPNLSDLNTIAQTSDGSLWFGGSGGLYRWRSGELTRFPIQAPSVFAIHQDREGTLWVVEQQGGLYRFRNERLEQVAAEGYGITEDRGGGIWLIGFQGLRYLRGGKTLAFDHTPGLPHTLFSSVFQDSSGTLWLSTQGGGLYRLRDGRLQAITADNGLHSDSPGGIFEDARGRLWFATNRGIFRLGLRDLNDVADAKTSSLSPVGYGVEEGMRNSECNSGQRGIWETRDGRIWFATMRGAVAVDPTADNPIPPPVALEEAWAGQVRIGREGRTSIPPGNNTFDFAFTALSLSAPEKQRFKYRLEPYDRDWIDAGTRRTAHYTNMGPGEYSFRVIAANSFGVWNNQGASIGFVLRPYLYQTRTFYVLGGVFFAALLSSAYLLRLRQLQHDFNVRLQERLEERTRIARELHDTLLQTFQASLIHMQAAYNLFSRRPDDARETLQTAIDISACAISEGREAIQDMRSSTVSEQGLARAILLAGETMASEGSARFEVRVQGSSRDIHPILRDDIYRIALEAMRNAFKHAEAKAIEAEIVYGESLRVRVRDDGKGIDPAILKEGRRSGHYGLPGMRERADRIGGKLDVWSGAGAGTEIQLSMPGNIAFGRPGAGSLFGRFRRKAKSDAAAQI